jgi:hypothetical protein
MAKNCLYMGVVSRVANFTEHTAVQPVRLAYQPPVISTFLSQQTSHQQPTTSQYYFSLRTNQHQPSATKQAGSQMSRSLYCELMIQPPYKSPHATQNLTNTCGLTYCHDGKEI